jgi:uncharacterized protein
MPKLLYATAFLAGLMGSAHCVAMCGGIATALGTARGGAAPAWHTLLHQLGRIGSYGLVGALAGALGAAVGLAFEASKWSAVLRIATAAMVVLIGLDMALGRAFRPRWLRAPERWGARLWRRMAPATRAAQALHPAARALALGVLWGWLPCGLVYSVLLAAAVSGSAVGGSVTMIAFGLGTLPAMLTLSYLGARLGFFNGTFARLAGSLLVACGLWTASMPAATLAGLHDHTHHQQSAD